VPAAGAGRWLMHLVTNWQGYTPVPASMRHGWHVLRQVQCAGLCVR
jgi:hypothetical protein